MKVSDILGTKQRSPQEILPLLKKSLARGPCSPASLEAGLGCDTKTLTEAIHLLEKETKVHSQGAFLSLEKPDFGYLPLKFLNHKQWIRIGLVADTHLCCKEQRLDALHAQYDLFAAEGISTVLHAGNIVDGYIPRINGASVIVSGIDDQALYVVDNYPQRKGITTHFITGDDHEGWWQKEGFNFGAYLQAIAERNDRHDLRYLGHVEADVDVTTKHGIVRIKVQHPGGGSAYSRSYVGQKQVEAFTGGEKPQILVQGHYHVSNYMVDRNIHVIGMPGFQDQTVFARKKRLRMEVGGAILSFTITEAGSVGRLSVEFNLVFDRGFYKAYLRSDKRLVKGHLILKN